MESKYRTQLPQDMRQLLDERDDNIEFISMLATLVAVLLLIGMGCFC